MSSKGEHLYEKRKWGSDRKEPGLDEGMHDAWGAGRNI